MGLEKTNIAKYKLSIFYREDHTILKFVPTTLQKFLNMTCKPIPNYLVIII